MKHRLGIVLALGLGLFGEASALAQQPAPPPPPPAAGDAAAPPSDQADPNTPPAPPSDQADPNTPPAPPPTPNPDAPPPPPPPGEAAPEAEPPPPVTLPPYLTGTAPTPLNPTPLIAPPTPMLTPPGPGPDAGVVPEKMPARVRWRGTNVSWGTNATTTALGLGRDNIGGEGEQVSMGWNLSLIYFAIEPKRADGTERGYSVRLQSALGFDVELTNSDTTRTLHEPIMRDLPLQVILSKPLWKSEDKEWAIGTALNGTVLTPTSKLSYDRGIYLTTSPRASLFFNIPLRGKDAPFLKSFLVGGSARWDHQFARATVPTNPDIARPRQTISGNVIISDQLTGSALATNSVRFGAFAFFGEKLFDRDLWITLFGGLRYDLLNEPTTSGCVQISTGCATPGHDSNPTTTRYNTSFGVSATYFPSAEWGFDITYSNGNGQLGMDGQYRNPFYSPDAQLSATLIVSIDAIYERLTGPARDEPVIYFGSNKKPRNVPQNSLRETLF